MKKILACILAVALLTCVFAACGKTEDKGDSSSDLKLALVVAGTFGDRSFYDSSKEGADRLAKDFGVQVSTIECNNENHATQMKNAADQADVVVCVGWEFYDVETIAPEYPNVKFIWIDNATSEPVANVLNITYAQNEGSFLAGYIAAAMSESGTVGAVGGEDSDTINDFIVGYTQGAEYYGTENGKAVNVVKNYAGTYDDPAKGKECALALHDQGADVIFQIASATGDGEYELGGQPVFLQGGVARLSDGTIAGSATNVYDCMLRAISFGIPREDAVRAATYNPARQLGCLDEVGSIRDGKQADFVICDAELNRREVWLAGEKLA